MEGVDRRGSQAKVVWRYTRPLGITRAAHGRARRRKRAAEGSLGGWGGFHLRRHLSRRDPERAAGLQLRDAPGRQEDLESLATMQLKAEGRKTTLMVTEQGAFLDGYDDAGSREQGTSHLLDALGGSLKPSTPQSSR